MAEYKVGDVAALFPNPPKPQTESGKKIQALFNDFYNKPSNPSKKWKNQKQLEGKEKQVEDKNESVVKKEPKKQKFRKSNITNSAEVIDVQIAKKPKLETMAPTAPFPRSKKGRNSNRESYLPKKTAKEENFSPKAKVHSQTNSAVPDKNPFWTDEDDSESDFPQSKMHSEELSGQKKKGKKKVPKGESVVPDEGIPDFLKLKPKDAREDSKVVFRMKRQRQIPSCKEIFENREPSSEEKRSDIRKAPQSSFAKEKVEEMEERLARTLFVGNLSVSTTKKTLEKLFSPFGTLESCRLRGAVPVKSTIPRKVAEIKQKYHSGLQSRIAYIVLKDRKSALSALSLNGMLIKGHHIVVDRASASGEHKKYDKKRTIFVGNLPFAITDETLWSTFLPCGDIGAVRVVRDKETGAGKGFGYVSFQKQQGREKALALNNLEINGRRLRIQGVGRGRKKKEAAPSTWKAAIKRVVKKNKKDGNLNSRKTLKKLMNRGKQQYQKKKVASIFKKLSKN